MPLNDYTQTKRNEISVWHILNLHGHPMRLPSWYKSNIQTYMYVCINRLGAVIKHSCQILDSQHSCIISR